jgi:hypothetical protein
MNTNDWVILSVGAFQSLALIGSAIFVGLQVHWAKATQQTMVDLERVKRSTDYIRRWNSREGDELRHKAIAAVRDGKVEEQHHAIFNYLNFFFEMAKAIEWGLADDDLCKSFFCRPLHHYWSDVEPHLLRSNNTGYDPVKKLDSRWQASRP